MARDFKANRRGCVVLGAAAAAITAAMAWGIASSDDDPRANGTTGAKVIAPAAPRDGSAPSPPIKPATDPKAH